MYEGWISSWVTSESLVCRSVWGLYPLRWSCGFGRDSIWIQAPHPRSRCCCTSEVIHTRSTSDARHAELQIREANPEAGVKMVFELPINIFALLDILRLSLPAGCRAGSGPGPETACQARRSAAGDLRSRVCANSSARFHFFSLPTHRRTCGTFNSKRRAHHMSTCTPL